MTDDARLLALACAEAAEDRKAEELVILDLRGISSFTDYFVVCSGGSEPQLKAIATSIRETVREKLGRAPNSEDGFPSSQWVVIDYGDVLVHIFHRDKREYYRLEDLWKDAPRVELPSVAGNPVPGPDA